MPVLKYDRPLEISVGTSRKDVHWKSAIMTVGDLW